jgi:hypothetical protein
LLNVYKKNKNKIEKKRKQKEIKMKTKRKKNLFISTSILITTPSELQYSLKFFHLILIQIYAFEQQLPNVADSIITK